MTINRKGQLPERAVSDKSIVMKKVYILAVALSLIVVSCRIRNGINHLFGFNFHRHGTTHIIENINNESTEIEYSGNFVFREDETGIKHMSPGSYLDYRSDDRRMMVELTHGGSKIGYELYDGSTRLPMNEEGRNFIAAAVRKMIAMGIFAEERAAQLYHVGGDSLVLSKIPELTSDQAKITYAGYLLQKNTLNSEEMTVILKEVGKSSSDIEKEQLLVKVPVQALDSPSTAKAYLEIIGSINSDIEKEQALGHITPHRLTDEQYAGALSVINSIQSDIQKEQALTALLDKSDAPDTCFDPLLITIGHINSDIEKSNVLKALFQKDIRPAAHWIALIRTVSQVNSDINKDDLLIEVSKRMPRTPEVQEAYITAAKTINSQQDYARVVSAVK